MLYSFPETLKNKPIWVLWRLEERDGSKPTKVPYSPNYNGRAKSNDPDTWDTYARAEYKLNQSKGYYQGLGIGISQEQGLIFIDIDHCISNGRLSEIAEEALSVFSNQYAEISQSGSGIHILALGTIPKSFKNSKNGVEIYCDKRFCSLTGNRLTDGEPCLEQAQIDLFYDKYKPPTPPQKRPERLSKALNKDDNWIIEHAMKSGKFAQLYSGSWEALYGSQSEADIALCSILAFWSDCNIDQMDRIFSSSGLYRKKWDRSDYRINTLNKAISQCALTISEYITEQNRKEAEEYAQANKSFWDSKY